MTERADKVLVQIGFARSRSHARDLIKRNLVKFNDSVVTKAGQLVIEKGLELVEFEDFVGRGALKIKSFLDHYPIDFQNKVVADIGAATGGFTEMALQLGAEKVFAVDVGHGQLAQKLLTNPKVKNMEGTNVKNVFHFPEKIQIMTVDLSFISTTRVLNNLVDKLANQAYLLVLFKPQFEVGPENIGKNGLVKNLDDLIEQLENDIKTCCAQLDLTVKDFFQCELKGGDGNQEYFVYATKSIDVATNH